MPGSPSAQHREAESLSLVEEPFYILARSPAADQHRRVLKQGDTVAVLELDGVLLAYEGLDGVLRRTRLAFSPPPASMSGTEASFRVRLPPKGEATLFLTVSSECGEEAHRSVPFADALAEAAVSTRQAREGA